MTAVIMIQDKEVALDKRGYLRKLSDWSPEVAATLAQQEDIELTEAHWELINLLRDFHQRSGLIPSTRALIKLMTKELGSDKGKSAYLMQLFPGTPLKTVCKISGLPRPTNCI
ncbi:MAG: sulfurtransferase TusE [Gammaproteobacteria bacterium]|nr:sulfurtransferase TusE [Gammaproteobacteria bacterium]MAY01717.1 sulfurtransferase TusE [Gammaproteobacteria bacterium]